MDRYVVSKIFFNEVIEVKTKIFNSYEDAKTYYNLSILPYTLSDDYFVNREGDYCLIDGVNKLEITLGLV